MVKATDAKEDKLAQLRKLLAELTHEDIRQAIVLAEERLDEPEEAEATEDGKEPKPDEEKVYTLEDLTESFPVEAKDA
jgi:hypothetical protein